jgi:hypothetical protein
MERVKTPIDLIRELSQNELLRRATGSYNTSDGAFEIVQMEISLMRHGERIWPGLLGFRNTGIRH